MEKKYNQAHRIAQQIADVMQSKDIENEMTLKEWVKMDPSSESTVDLFTHEDKLAEALRSFDQKEISDRSHACLKRKIERSKQKRRKRFSLYSGGVAAALIAVSMLVWNYFNANSPYSSDTLNHFTIKTVSMDVVKPTLILNNGEQIDLSDRSSNQIAAYEEGVKEDSTTVSVIECNTLIIPSEYTYSIVLEDGTKIMLNANSKLIYPVKFDKNKREVTLEGEAFFEVSKSDVPFIVKSRGMSVRVYGTKFSVNNYDPDKMETVLLAGSVGVTIDDRNDLPEQMLKPNQLSMVNTSEGVSEVAEVDAATYISWISGRIKSYNSTLGELITKLSSWYGVDFQFTNSDKCKIPVTASFKQDQSIENVIEAIEYTAKVKIEKKEGGYVVN